MNTGGCGCGRPDCIGTTPPGPWRPPRLATNEFGTPITEFVCRECGHHVSVCPAIPLSDFDRRQGGVCLGNTCPSYDISRDVDIFFEPAVEAGWIRRRPA